MVLLHMSCMMLLLGQGRNHFSGLDIVGFCPLLEQRKNRRSWQFAFLEVSVSLQPETH